MIKHLAVLYLAFASVLVIGPNPLWILPLIMISASYITGNRYLGIAGVLLFFTVTLGRIPDQSFSDLPELAMLVAGLVIPGIIALELVLSDRPYVHGRLSPVPVVVAVITVGCMVSGVMVLSRLQRIGLYLGSDPMLQVFMFVSLAVLFTGPVLLARGTPGKGQK
jgi:hypothetical protein